MLQAFTHLYYRLPLKIQNIFTNGWYEQMSLLDREANMIFMNYGWAALASGPQPLSLQPEDETNRYCIQLYHRVAGAVSLQGRDVLEVGCGRGGGASYIARYLSPKRMTGMDRARNAVRFCRKHYAGIPGLSFVQGDAQALKFTPASLDAVVNVESSHCYNAVHQFYAGVYSILKPGGYFLYTDHWEQYDLPGMRRLLSEAGFSLIEEEEINANVLRALELDNERKQAFIKAKVPLILQSLFNEFAAMQGTHSFYNKLHSGERKYLRFVLRK